MFLRTYLRVLRERWRTLVSVTLIGLVVAVVVTVLTPKSYTASAQVFVSASARTDPNAQAQANSYVQTQVTSYAKVIGSPDVISYVRSNLDPSLSDEQVKSEITASAQAGESIVVIQVSDGSAARAADLANSAARGFVRAVEHYSPYTQLFLTGPASTPAGPTSPQPALNITLGLVLGLLVGSALARVRDVLDDRVRDPDEVAAAAQAPLLGTIVEDGRSAMFPVASRDTTRSVRAENYRQLRTNVQFANVDNRARVIAVTSPVEGEGKTTVAVNLAASLAESGYSVCLVDADLRESAVAGLFGLGEDIGLTNVLVRRLPVRDALQEAGRGLYVLTAGPTPPNPSEILASGAMRELVSTLLEYANYVVLDTAALLPVADAAEAAALADTTLLVSRHGVTTDTNVRQAADLLRRVDTTLAGVVLNRLPRRRGALLGGSSLRRNRRGGPAVPMSGTTGRPRPNPTGGNASASESAFDGGTRS